MMKMAFPNSKNMGDAMGQMQQMLSGLSGRGGFPGAGGGRGVPGGANTNAQMKMAMDLLQQMQQKGGKRK